jgi:hypothetical protein
MRDKDKTATRWQTKRNRYDNLPMVVFFLFSSWAAGRVIHLRPLFRLDYTLVTIVDVSLCERWGAWGRNLP